MSQNRPTDPLDSLQFMLNDVIIQIGKALRAASTQPGRRNVAQVQASLQSHMPNTIENFHLSLDDLESEIIRAKAALQRDLDRVQAKPLPQPTPVKDEPTKVETSQTAPVTTKQKEPKQPSPAPEPLYTNVQAAPRAKSPQSSPAPPMAPFPDMGIGSIPTPDQADVVVKQESTSSAPQAMMDPVDDEMKSFEEKPSPAPAPKTEPAPAPKPEPAPTQAAPEAPMDDLFGLESAGAESALGAGEFNFTDMTFGLAPANNDQGQSTAPQADMDISGFSNEDMNSFDQFLTGDASVQQAASKTNAEPSASATLPNTAPTAPMDIKMADQEQAGGQTADDLDDIFDLGDSGNAMDLDMGLGGGGVDGSNFEAMYYDDTNMEDRKFDDEFFGL